MTKTGYVYLLASKRNGTLYVGVTSDLIKRMYQHQTGELGGFTAKHNVKSLVWFEVHAEIQEAIAREKAIKKWRRQWKMDLIEKHNPDWHDLSAEQFGFPLSRE